MTLLEKLYKISSPSGQEKNMRKFIKEFCKNNVPDAIVKQDKARNIYITKGEDKTYPCVVAHMDEVHDKNKNKEIVIHDNLIFGLDRKAMKLTGIGADDKNGIWVALNLLTTEKVLKCAFFVGEETGCIGSHQADMVFFSDVRFVVQCDRRNGTDFIMDASGVELSDKGFYERCEAAKFGYKVTTGLQTDVVTLKERHLGVCAVNLSCGYYNPHQETEMTRFDELQNCLALCEHIIKTVLDVQNHKYERKSHFGSQCLYGIDDFGAHPWGIVQRQDNWHQQNERMKLVARTDIEQDYLRLIDVHKEEEIRSYLKNKYRFLNDSHFVEQCIDEWIADNGTF